MENENVDVEKKKEKKRKERIKDVKWLVSILLFFASIFLFTASLIILLKFNDSNLKTVIEIDKDVSYSMIETTISKTYDKVSKGSVAVYSQNSTSVSIGSGVIYKKEGNTFYVVTNYHVVNGFSDNNIYYMGEYEKANLLGYDYQNDIAILTFSFSTNNKKLNDMVEVIDFFNYATYKVPTIGEVALAVGSPLGVENYNTLTVGTISNRNTLEIVTDASINNGNSGGGLFNINGELLGIVYKKQTTSASGSLVEGRGYALNIQVVMATIKNIEKNNVPVQSAYLHLDIIEINRVIESNSTYMKNFPNDNKNTHIFVTENPILVNNCKQYDCILKLDDKEVNTLDDINYIIRTTPAGTKLNLTLYRDGEVINTTVTL